MSHEPPFCLNFDSILRGLFRTCSCTTPCTYLTAVPSLWATDAARWRLRAQNDIHRWLVVVTWPSAQSDGN